jgi:hypothetical protein
MGDRKRRRDAFFKTHPNCCFCGGATPATTEDHQPGRVFFRGRNWPEGFVFPACAPCNEVSRESEKLLAVLIHGEGDSDDRGKFQSLIESVHRDYPDLFRGMLPRSTREIREILRKSGLERPSGTPYRDVPVIKLDTKFWTPHLNTFARKLMLALHYQCFGVPLPRIGAIWHFAYSNVDFMAGRFPEQLLKLTEQIAIPARQRSLLGDQFMIRWNVVPSTRTGIFLCQLHGRLAVCGITTDTPRKFVNAWKQIPMRPYDH